MSSRPTVVIGNWKMHKTIADSRLFTQELVPLVANASCPVRLAVPFTCLSPMAQDLIKNQKIKVGAQNISEHEEGAWTGEISAHMVKDAGADFVLVGHSERRMYFKETNAEVRKKIKRALFAGLQPVVCIGETLVERELGQQFQTIENQIREGLLNFSEKEAENLMFAYEPVWAIGTGKNATAEIAQEMHLYCRRLLKELFGLNVASKASILYGGSANPENAAALLAQPDVDGLLVGKASLEAVSFSRIVNININHRVV